MAYALTVKAAAALTQAFSNHDTRKEYLAVAWGVLPEGELRDLLFHDRRTNKTFVADRQRAGVKEAVLLQRTEQTALLEDQPVSLLRVTLLTGRSHQIRVQLASRKHPLLGDRRYGSSVRCPGIALWSAALELPHPLSGERLRFTQLPPREFPWDLFSIDEGGTHL